MENVELGDVIHGALLRDNEGISLEGNFIFDKSFVIVTAIKGSFSILLFN